METPERHDHELVDEALLAEIELVADLVVAAADEPDHLSQEQIDRVLGVSAQTEPDQGPDTP